MPDNNLHDAVAAAFDSLVPDEAEAPVTPSRPEPTAPSEPQYRSEQPTVKARLVEPGQPTMESEQRKAAERARDEKGKFTKDSAAKAAPPEKPAAPVAESQAAAPGTEPTEPTAPAAASTELKAPANWKPAAREKWGTLPPEVQAEAVRVHGEVNKAMQESAEARKAYDEIREAIRPYEAQMQAAGYTPARALQEHGQLSYTVHQGTGEQLGQLLANMAGARRDPDRAARALAQAIDTLGLDVEHVNKYLGAPQSAPQQQQPVDINAAVEQALQARIRAAMGTKQQQEEQTFAAKHEFYQDVAPRMKAIRAADASLPLDEVYKIACQMDPEISKVLAQRDAAAKARAGIDATQRAKAATGVKPSPAVAVSGTKSRSIKDSVAAAFDAHSNNR